MKAATPGPILGCGMTADVYAWGTDRVVKHFHDPDPTLPNWEREMTLHAHSLGLPAPEVFELTSLHDRPALIMERLHGPNAAEILLQEPHRGQEIADAMLDLWERLWSVNHPESAPLANLNLKTARKITSVRSLSARHKHLLVQRMEILTQDAKLCHGDLQLENLIMTPKGPFLIDWLDFSSGDPTADFARCLLNCHLGDLDGHFTPLFHNLHQKWYAKSGADPRLLEGWLRIMAASFIAVDAGPHQKHLYRIATGAEVLTFLPDSYQP